VVSVETVAVFVVVVVVVVAATNFGMTLGGFSLDGGWLKPNLLEPLAAKGDDLAVVVVEEVEVVCWVGVVVFEVVLVG
jgi:hypothetical protein